MTRNDAVLAAAKSAKANGDDRFVVFEDGEFHFCTEFDLDYWFVGIEPECMVTPDGEVH